MKYTMEEMIEIFNQCKGNRQEIRRITKKSYKALGQWARRIHDRYPDFKYYKTAKELKASYKHCEDYFVFATNDERLDNLDYPDKRIRRHTHNKKPIRPEDDNYGFDYVPGDIEWTLMI